MQIKNTIAKGEQTQKIQKIKKKRRGKQLRKLAKG